MKTKLLIIGAAALLAAASGYASDDSSVTIRGKAPTRYVSKDEAATQACLQRFVDEILPAGTARVRVVNATSAQIFSSQSAATRMNVAMSARTHSDNREIATGHCVVDSSAKVAELTTRVLDNKKLAGLHARDLKFAIARR